MKYLVDLSRHETRTVEVFAEDRDQAAQRAREAAPGFSVEGLDELGDNDEPVAAHVPVSACEACGAAIWEGDAYASGDDADLCRRCMPKEGEA